MILNKYQQLRDLVGLVKNKEGVEGGVEFAARMRIASLHASRPQGAPSAAPGAGSSAAAGAVGDDAASRSRQAQRRRPLQFNFRLSLIHI